MTPTERQDLAARFLDMQVRAFRQSVRWGIDFNRRPARETVEDRLRACGDPIKQPDGVLTQWEMKEGARNAHEVHEIAEELQAIIYLLDNWRIERPRDMAAMWLQYNNRRVLA